MRDTINSNFYIVSATVIPLFYVTLILQGPFAEVLERMNKKIGKYEEQLMANIKKYPSILEHSAYGLRNYIMSWLWACVGVGAFYLSMLAILGGLFSEGLSLWSLLYQRDAPWIRYTVLWTMLALLPLMAARPILAITKAAWVRSSN